MTTAGAFSKQTVYTVRKTDRVTEAAQRMREHHVGDLVVVDDRGGQRLPVGIVTDRDLVVGVLAGPPERVASLQVGDVLTERLVVARAEDPIEEVIKRMEAHGIRRLPVVDVRGALVGIVVFDDLLASLTGQLADLTRLLGQERRREEMLRR